MKEIRRRFLNRANTLLGLQFLSDFGDQITAALLAACLLDITQSASKVGFVYFITTAGYIVFTLVGGFIGDHLSKRNILFFSDLGRGIVVLLMILAFQQKSITLIYATSFFLAVLGSLHRPVKSSIWAEAIPENRLECYNSLSEFSIQASAIVGPLIASLFIANDWTNHGFVIDAVTFFLCAIVFARIIAHSTNSRPAEEGASREYLKGFSTIFSEREISKYVAYDAIQMIGFGAFNALFLVLAQRDFGWTKADYSYHLSILALFTTCGAFLGATSYVAKMDHINKLRTCALVSAFTLCGALLLEVFPLASILVGICDGVSVLTMTVTKTKVQILAKNHHAKCLTSIIAARFIIIKIATLIGIAACLIVDNWLGLKFALILFLLPVALSVITLLPKQIAFAASLPSASRSRTLK